MDANRGLFISLTGVLLGFGLLMVHSASITSWPNSFEQVYLSRHAAFLLLAVCGGLVCALLPARVWFVSSPWLFTGTLILLVLVLVSGIGTEVNGARRWLRFSGLSIQPSEIAKLTLPLLLGRILVRSRTFIRHWFWGTIPLILPVALIVPLVFLEPDLGTSVFLVLVAGIMLWIAGWPLRNYLVGLLVLAPLLGAFLSMKPYQLERLRGYVAAWEDLNHAPYQVRQSLMTLGAGGLDGVGVGRGWQKLSFLPEANTDFVFSVIGEELGLAGTLCLVAVWCGLFVSGYSLLKRHHRASYPYLVGMTLLAELVLQAAINVAVVTAVVPPKGISHPFISYGGSNLVVSLTAIGIILSLTAVREPVVLVSEVAPTTVASSDLSVHPSREEA